MSQRAEHVAVSPAKPPVLSVRQLRISLAALPHAPALVDGLDFELAAGEVLGLVGESGCGKSLTAAALLGLVLPETGQVSAAHIRLGNTELAQLDERGWRRLRGRDISMIFQEPLTALDPVLSIGQQLLAVIRRHRKVGRKVARQLALDSLQSVGISDAVHLVRQYPHQLSGGMRQRVMIAMAMLCQPQVLVADEPTTALDVTTQAQILQQLRQLARQTGTAVLLISHDLGVVASSCDRAMVMYCGRVVEEGPVDALFRRPRHPYTAALLAARPRLSATGIKPVAAIPGTVPAVSQLPAGCRFNTRCPQAGPACQNSPGWTTDQPGAPSVHRYACHHPLPAAGGAGA